jgi:hypothetical protein
MVYTSTPDLSPIRSCRAAALWLITAAIAVATVMLLWILWLEEGDLVPAASFLTGFLSLALFLPLWKWKAQECKVLLRGPWDIPTAATMRLDEAIDTKKTI